MKEEAKKEECCGGETKKNCGCCCGIKKLVLGVLLVLFIFFCGYVTGKGYCPFSSCSTKMCPITKQ